LLCDFLALHYELTMAPPCKLLDQLRAVLRRKHYSRRTEDSPLAWVLGFIRFHQLRHPRDLGPPQIGAFLTHLAVADRVAASTQNQARSALLLLYQEVLALALDALPDVEPAQRPQRLPSVLRRDEVRAVLAQIGGTYGFLAQLLSGSAVRLIECVRLPVKHLDFAQQQLVVRDGKAEKDRLTCSLGVWLQRLRIVEPQRQDAPAAIPEWLRVTESELRLSGQHARYAAIVLWSGR
jgi:site-specific recombinase XerD